MNHKVQFGVRLSTGMQVFRISKLAHSHVATMSTDKRNIGVGAMVEAALHDFSRLNDGPGQAQLDEIWDYAKREWGMNKSLLVESALGWAWVVFLSNSGVIERVEDIVNNAKKANKRSEQRFDAAAKRARNSGNA